MNDRPLMEVVVDAVVFFELSDEQTIDNDTAIAMLEQIATTLRQLDPATRKRFLEYAEGRAAQAMSQEERDLLNGLGDSLGLLDEIG